MVNKTFNYLTSLDVSGLNMVNTKNIDPNSLHYDVLCFINQLILNKTDINRLKVCFNNITKHFKYAFSVNDALCSIRAKVVATIDLLKTNM